MNKVWFLILSMLMLQSCFEEENAKDSLFKAAEDSQSEEESVEEVDPIGAEAINLLAPVDAAYSAGASLDFQITFNEIVSVTGSPCLSVNIGGTSRSACYESGDGSSSLFFSYTIQAGENDSDGIGLNGIIDLNGGSIQANSLDIESNFAGVVPDLSGVTVNTSIAGPDQVNNLNQTDLSEDRTEVTFNWSEPNDNGSPITYYSIRYKKTSESQFSYLSPNPSGNSTTIYGLDTESTYEIQVAAFNGVMGSYSESLNVSTVFNPASLGALIWYEAKDINNDGVEVADGTSVDTFYDKSGNGNNAAKISGTSATIETVDGKKVIRLDSSGYRTVSSLGETANTDVEVYVVAKTRQVTNSFCFVNENQANNDRYGSHFPWGNGNAYVDLTMGNRFSGPWGGNTTDFFAWTFRSSTTQGKALERNGVEILNAGNKTNTAALKRWTIGSDYAGAGTYWKADLQAIFVFDKVLTTSQRADFFTYLENEYGVEMQ